MGNCKECKEWANLIDGICFKYYGENRGLKVF